MRRHAIPSAREEPPAAFGVGAGRGVAGRPENALAASEQNG